MRFRVAGVYGLMKDIIEEEYADKDACLARGETIPPGIELQNESKETDDLLVAADIIIQGMPPEWHMAWVVAKINHPFGMWFCMHALAVFPELSETDAQIYLSR